MQSVAKLNAIRCVFSLLFSIKLTYKQIIIQTYTYVNSIIYILYTFICLGLENIIMTLFERIKSLAKSKNKNVKQLALELGFSENLFYKWKTSSPKAKDLEKVAEYFNVSVDYLLGRTDNPNPVEKKQLTVEEALSSVMSSDGKPLTENDREILSGIIEAYLEKKNK